jgi:putative ABC transport system permease protein
VRPAVLVLFGAMACVLLIACANVASLLLAKSASRRREMAIRTALGAARRRLVRQLLVECVLLALVGGAGGVALAFWGVEGLRWVAPAGTLGMEQAAVDARVLPFAVVLSVATGLFFGLAPAREASRLDLGSTLGERSAAAPRRRARAAIVVAETGVAVMLLAGAGLMLRSVAELLRVDPGFDPESVLSATVRLPDTRYPADDDVRSFTARLVEQGRTLPGARQAAVTSRLPLSPQGGDTYFKVLGEPEPAQGKPTADIRAVGPGYFQTLGIRVLRGRDIAARDAAGAPSVVVVNEPFARTFLAGRDPLGQRLRIDVGRPVDAEVVGVVAGIRQYSPGFEPNPAMYVAVDQLPNRLVNLVVRSGADVSSTAASLHRLVRGLDVGLPVDVVALEQRLSRSTAATRSRAALVGGFATTAVLLAAVGVYGLMAGFVADRRREIGVRMALGARVEDVVGLIFIEGARLAGAGIVLGLVAALALGRALSSLLFAIRPWDPVTFVAVATLVALVAAMACAMPARQAAGIDPSRALRED